MRKEAEKLAQGSDTRKAEEDTPAGGGNTAANVGKVIFCGKATVISNNIMFGVWPAR